MRASAMRAGTGPGAWGIGNANFLVGLHIRGRSDVLGSVLALQSTVAADRISRSVRAV
jgi:hypothetical protein